MLVLLILILAELASISESTINYIKPSINDSCPANEQACLTLSEFSENLGNNPSITAIVLPGDHSLVRNLSFSNLTNLRVYTEDVNTNIKCQLSSQFSFESIEYVSIKKVIFLGCGNNVIRNVEKFILQESEFLGLEGTGTSLTLINSTVEIVHCTFVGNQFGTSMESVESLKLILNHIAWLIVRKFNISGIVHVGGMLFANHSDISISHSRFENNTAEIGGDIFADKDNNISIYNSTFIGNSHQTATEESLFGGAIYSHHNTLSIVECRFHKKHATVGASVMSTSSNVTVNRSTFDSNLATDHSAGLFSYNSTVYIYWSNFHNNTALAGAGVTTYQGEITVAGCIFTSNRAQQHGAALEFYRDTSTVMDCRFDGNVAFSFAGAVLFWSSTGNLYGKTVKTDALEACDEQCSGNYQWAENVSAHSKFLSGNRSQFINNLAPTGAALHVLKSTLKICGPIIFSKNLATHHSSVYFLNSIGEFWGFIVLTQNSGSFFAFNSNITFSGCANFTSGSPYENTTANFKEGGAITLYQAKLSLQGEARFEYNSAEIGGAILATESQIYLHNQTHILNNSACISGGGLYLSQSELFSLQNSILIISGNSATEKGGGMDVICSLIRCSVTGLRHIDQNEKITEEYMAAIVKIQENSAQRGGGIHLEGNSKITIIKEDVLETDTGSSALNFIGNSAQYGGAIYVDDATNFGTCESNPFEVKLPKSECFISIVSTQTIVTINTNFSLKNIVFDSNTGTISGTILFGGLLDRCIVSPFNEVGQTIDQATNNLLTYRGSGLQYLLDISAINENDTQRISSYPVRVCLCVNGHQTCDHKMNRSVRTEKGHSFIVPLVAVDQVYRPVNATIQGYPNSVYSNLLLGRVTKIPNKCTNVTFQVTSRSSQSSEELTLFASDGPCKDAELSKLRVNVTFLPCSCPIGFIVSGIASCQCVCHPQIRPFVIECNSATQSFRRKDNVWITHANGTSNLESYLIIRHCPFDYCITPKSNININLNQPNGADAQCAFNRAGMLCGACKPGLSLSLGSSNCLKCPSYWPAQFVIITVLAILAGIILVILVLWLNITVAVGTLNGLLFYANIVAANRAVFLPNDVPNFISVFISWLNFELGIDICYIDGMDVYMRTWIQLAFPIYIIFLVILVIIISRYSSKFSHLISKRNPVATLATLILISYGKLLHVVLLAQPFSFVAGVYSNGYRITLWLPDGTVGYLSGKHIILFVVALVILTVCITFSFLLLCWQLVLFTPNWTIVKCTKSPTFNLFMEAYHAPYTPKHHYWTGLLLLARTIIYLIAVANDPQLQLVSTAFIVSCIILLKMMIATKIFKNQLIDSLESFFYFNIIIFASFTAYNRNTVENQRYIALASIFMSMIITGFILFYHVYAYSSLFFCLRSHLKGFKNGLTSKLKPKVNCDLIIHDVLDLNDILVSDAEYHSADFCSVKDKSGPTSSVVEIN